MGRHHRGPQPGEEEGDEREDRTLDEQRQTERQTQAEVAPHRRPGRGRRVRPRRREQAAGARQPAPGEQPGQAQGHDQQGQGRGPAAADPAEFRQAEPTVDEERVGDDVHRQADKAGEHGQPRPGQAVAAALEGEEHPAQRQSPADGEQVAGGDRDHLGAHPHPHHERSHGPEQRHEQHPGRETDGHAQADGAAHRRRVAAAVGLGDQGRDRALQAEQEEKDREEQRRAHRHRRQVDTGVAAGHDRVDEAHGGLGQLGEEQGQGQPDEQTGLMVDQGEGTVHTNAGCGPLSCGPHPPGGAADAG